MSRSVQSRLAAIDPGRARDQHGRDSPSAGSYLPSVPSDILACILAFLAPSFPVHTYAQIRTHFAALLCIGTVSKRLHAAFPVSVLRGALRCFEPPPFEPIFLQDLRTSGPSKVEFMDRLRVLDAAYLGWRREWPFATIFSGKVRSVMKIPGVVQHYLPFQYQSFGSHKHGRSIIASTSAAAWLALCIHGPKSGFRDLADAERHRRSRPPEVAALEKQEEQRRRHLMEAKRAQEQHRARNRAYVNEWLRREHRATGPSVALAQRTCQYKSLVCSSVDIRDRLTPAFRVEICREIVQQELGDLCQLLGLRDACAQRAAHESLVVPATLLISADELVTYPINPAGLRAFRGSSLYLDAAATIERNTRTIELAIRVAQLDKRWAALCTQFRRQEQRLYACCGVPVCTPETRFRYPPRIRPHWGPADKQLLDAREHAYDAFCSDARRLADLHGLVMASGVVVQGLIAGSDVRGAVASLVELFNGGKSLEEIRASGAFGVLERGSFRVPLALPAPGSHDAWVVRIQEAIADHGLDGETIKNELREAGGYLPRDFPHPFYKFCFSHGVYVRKI